MKIKPKYRGWKEGILTKEIINGYGQVLKKGETVRYKRYKEWDTDTNFWTGKYEYHYMNQCNNVLIRIRELLINEK